MYTEYSTAEQRAAPQENISRQSAPARRAAPRRRRSRRYDRRRVLLIGMALVLFLGGFISGCCVGRAHGSSPANSESGADVSGSKQQKSNIPASITLPNYVKEDLLPVNEYSRCGDKLQRVNAVVIHYVGNPNTTAWQNRSYFANLATTGETSASSNLIVGLEGEALLCAAGRGGLLLQRPEPRHHLHRVLPSRHRRQALPRHLRHAGEADGMAVRSFWTRPAGGRDPPLRRDRQGVSPVLRSK